MVDNIKNSCFLIKVQDQNEVIIDRGTGFFINENGFFISAGHVFKNPNYSYAAEIEEKSHKITEIYSEYTPEDEYHSNLFTDLFIGKINIIPVASVIFSEEKPKIDEIVTISGYNRLLSSVETSTFRQLNTSVEPGACVKVNKKTDNFYILINAFRISPIPQASAGLSGGPVTLNETCVGILNTTGECLLSNYILQKLKELKISFNRI
ncbi:trypsin-like serine protease [Sphingobacterium hungaricum]|uniref:Peptidase S1 domain-containing protein n=1 Tax=Sphingobacterium hungaricum TaxID=2082723 RepID=A0A928YP93_9SPHI|nr:trypsin-like serine protease [Sphingobacterium hungaricum]MBE8712709.1 hypothetical protein [Sphingobacterium hungaricum]